MLSHHVPFRNLVTLFQFETTHNVFALSSCLKGMENSPEPAIDWEGFFKEEGEDFLKRKHRCLFNGNNNSLIPLRTNDNPMPSKTAPILLFITPARPSVHPVVPQAT